MRLYCINGLVLEFYYIQYLTYDNNKVVFQTLDDKWFHIDGIGLQEFNGIIKDSLKFGFLFFDYPAIENDEGDDL